MKNKYFYLTLFFSILVAVLPFLFILKTSNWSYPKIPVQITDDSIFYYTRAVDIYKGHPFIGNPYVLEHKDSISANFFVADWLWSAPLFLGFSVNQTVFLNQIIWFVIFSLILRRIFIKFDLSEKMSVWGVFVNILGVYWYLSRPVAMQIVYPLFLGFILLFFLFIKNPDSWRRRVSLGIYSGLTLYTYTYLAYIMALAYILMFGYYLFKLDRRNILSVFISGFISLILAAPFIYYTLLQTSQLYYFETVRRLGLLYTHSLSSAGLVYFLVCFSIIFVTYLYRKYFSNEQFFLFQIISIALAVSAISNTIIGIDFELAQHVGRFIDLYLCIFLFIISIKIYKNNDWWDWKLATSSIVILFVLINIFSGQLSIWNKISSKLLTKESYSEPLYWLKNNTKPGSVVLANDDISEYIPLLTNDYIVFNNYVGFHIMSDEEVVDRYLVSRVFSGLNVDILKNDFRKFAGVGNAVHQYKLYNRKTRICIIAKRIIKKIDCSPLIGPYDLKGEKYFTDLINDYDFILKGQSLKFKEYNISYILVDREKDKWTIPRNVKLIWSNERYSIYKI